MEIYSGENGIITLNDPRYPKSLKSIPDAPEQLYYKGTWDESLFENCLAVVGSRRMTTYGKQITEKLVSQIASAGITIVSGFMYGIDGQAHQSCLDVGGRTIAVMPCGINKICPQYHDILYRDILENNGLIISEFPPDQTSLYWMFPRRNRTVAGLSKATLVIEAGEKSGSLITADLTKKFNKKVFAVPGPLTSILSKGTSQLIKEGAEIVTCAEDVINYFKIKKIKNNNLNFNFNKNKLDDIIFQELQREPLEMDILSRKTGKSIAEISSAISMMQIKGIIRSEYGKYYVC